MNSKPLNGDNFTTLGAAAIPIVERAIYAQELQGNDVSSLKELLEKLKNGDIVRLKK